MKSFVSSLNFQEEVARVTKQVETLLSDPSLQERVQLFADKMKADPRFQRQEEQLAKEMKAWLNAEKLAVDRIEVLDKMADSMIDKLFGSAFKVSTLGSSILRIPNMPTVTAPRTQLPITASHSFGVSNKQVVDSRLPLHVPRASSGGTSSSLCDDNLS